MSSSQIAVSSSDSPIAASRSELPVSQRSAADWIGALTFVGITVWTITSGWLPVVKESLLAGVLLLPNWLTTLLNAAGFLRRKPLVAATTQWPARLVAHVVTFSWPIYFASVGKDLHIAVRGLPFVLATLVAVVAGVYMVWGAWALRNSWSVEPQARVLVTDGPFEFSRHPLYSSYLLRNIAAVVLYLDLRLALVLLFWAVLLLYRVRCEERILGQCYPEYEQYRQRVWMFSPRWF